MPAATNVGMTTKPDVEIETLSAETLETIQGGKLPPGYAEAMAAGEKAAQNRGNKELLLE
jgi:hypothetical protein